MARAHTEERHAFGGTFAVIDRIYEENQRLQGGQVMLDKELIRRQSIHSPCSKTTCKCLDVVSPVRLRTEIHQHCILVVQGRDGKSQQCEKKRQPRKFHGLWILSEGGVLGEESRIVQYVE